MSRLTDSLLGLSADTVRAPNTYSLGRYLGILFIILLGTVYALPNLYPPDFALQIRAEAADSKMTQEIVDRATKALDAGSIRIKGTHFDEKNAVLRLYSNEDQLRGSELVQAALQGGDASATSPFVVALNLASTTPAWLDKLGAHPMSYGLDLSGGVHFLLEVDMEKALGDRMKSEEDNIRRILREARMRYVPGGDMVSGTRINIAFYEASVRDAALEELTKEYRDFQILARDVDAKPGLWLTMKDAKVREIQTYAVSQNLQSLRNRVNELGVSEPLVQSLGQTRIVVDLPGVQDSADAKRILNKFANLEFRLVAKQDARPSETESYPYEGRTIVIERSNIVTGDRVTDAIQDFDPENNQPQVSITLDSVGGDRMHDATKDNVGNQMAILYKELKPRTRKVVEDGKTVTQNFSVEEKRLINVATVRSALGFRFRITGVGVGEARDLALLLRAGALAAPMYIVEERTVGASLGEDNIQAGLRAAIGGYLLVLLTMVFYYKAFGLIANIALAINVILLVALLSVLGATLTMPGIAGIVLTMGMAVDANVLIFSRVREEAEERPPQAAITAGFDRAFTTIVDSNLTHLLVALVLLGFGTGPIKGFAVVLTLGIVTSMFTAITVTRAMVNLAFGGRNLKRLWV